MPSHKTFFLALIAALGLHSTVRAQQIPQLGMVSNLSQDSLLHAAGFTLLGTSVSSLISPSIPEQEFKANMAKLKKLKCRVYMCNVLFPGSIKIAGPDVDEQRALRYLDTVLSRAQQAGIPNLILGSGGARRLPEGYDPAKAKKDFVPLARKMAEAAKTYGITIILENINSTETNFLNKLKDAADVVRAVNHPNLRLNADIYHMMKEQESPQEIINARDLIVYAEIAEKEQRTLPGITGEDFRPYLTALAAIKYNGPIMIEGKVQDLSKEAVIAHRYLTSQLQEVYRKSK